MKSLAQATLAEVKAVCAKCGQEYVTFRPDAKCHYLRVPGSRWVSAGYCGGTLVPIGQPTESNELSDKIGQLKPTEGKENA